MTPVFKSLLATISLAVLALQAVSAQVDPLMAGLGAGVGIGAGVGYGGDFGAIDPLDATAPTHVPVGPITIAAETDFVPINNVWPVVNVLPTDYNDYSWYGPYAGGYPGGYGGYPGDFGGGFGGIAAGGVTGFAAGGVGMGGMGGMVPPPF